MADPEEPPAEPDALQHLDARAARAVLTAFEATGERFFQTIVEQLAAALEVEYALVSELVPGGERYRTIAVWGRGALLPDLESPLSGTPCEAVLAGRATHFADGIQERFPRDAILREWHVTSYAGIPFFDSSGAVAGHCAVLGERPLPDAAHPLAVLRLFAARIRVERERLHAERALRESESAYRDLYENAPLSYMAVDLDGVVRLWNARGREIAGFTDEELHGRHVLDFLTDTEANRAAFDRMTREVFGEGRDMVAEVEGKRGDGSTYWARCWLRPTRAADGSIAGYRSIALDVTELRRAEEARRESDERLAAVISSALDAIIAFDEDGRIVVFNAAAERTLRCAASDALGTPVTRFTTPAAERSLRRAAEAMREGGRAHAFSEPGLVARRADGEEFEFEASLSRATAAGRVVFSLVLRDLAERRRLEREHGTLARQAEYLQQEINEIHHFDEIVGRSAALAEVLRQVELVAATDATALILGETGTGKELIARAIHARSARRSRPLVKLNCAALSPGLVESEMFGHERGAFTGATERRIGRFELAHRGTIFLDEIGELAPELQAKLLRVLQEQELERVGGSTTIRVDVRVIAATNRDLAARVREGAFREDLFYRLNVFPVRLPPLRDRRDDLPLLVHYFVRRHAARLGRAITRPAPGTLDRLAAYPWPGNVRELENVVERAVILSPGNELEVSPELLLAAPGERAAASPGRTAGGHAAPADGVAADGAQDLESVERRYIATVLERTGWRIEGESGAASILGLSPSTLRSRMQRLGIRRPASDDSTRSR